MRTDLSGTSLLGRYRLERRLGQGGHASVYAAKDRLRGTTVAFKLLRPRNPEAFEALRSEFRLLAGLYHPNLCQVHDFGRVRVEGTLLGYYTATLIDGLPIDRYAGERPWPWLEHALGDALRALDYLHRADIRHGDFKPANVLVDENGRATLIDLGCSIPPVGAVSGTKGFIAPELFDGRPPDVRSDLYAVGCTIRQLARASSDVPERVAKIADRLCRSEPADRPAEIQEVVEALGLTREVSEARPRQAPALLGRQSVLSAATTLVADLKAGRAGPRVLMLYGPRGSGKTRALIECKWLAQVDLRVLELDLRAPAPVETLLCHSWEAPFTAHDMAIALEVRSRIDTSREPLLMLLDDTQRLPERERQILWAVLRLVRNDDPIGFILTDSSFATEAIETVRNIELSPLTESEVRLWVGPVPTDRFVADLVVRSRGLPRGIERALASRYPWSGDNHSEVAASPTDPLASRLQHLGSDGLRALGLCIALGGRIDLEEASMLGLTPPNLTALCESGWLGREQDALRIASEEDADSIAKALGEERMAGWHAEIAVAWERDRSREKPAIAYHWAAAREAERAERILNAATTDFARDPHAWRAPVERLAALAPTPGHLLMAAEVLELSGDLEPASAWLERCFALRLELSVEERAAVELRAGSIALKKGDTERSLEHLRGAQEVEPAPEKRAIIADLICRVHIQRGSWSAVAPIAERALEWTTHDETRAVLHEDLGVALSYLGRPDEAEHELDTAQRLNHSAIPRHRVRTIAYRAIHDFRRGRLDAAESNSRLALEIAEGAGLLDQAATCALNLATVQHRRGNWGAALQSNDQGLRRAIVTGKTRTIVTLFFNLAQLYCEIGHFERAIQQVTQASERAERANFEFFIGLCAMLRGEIACLQRKTDVASVELDRAEKILRARDARREVADVLLHRVELALVGDVASSDAGLGAPATTAAGSQTVRAAPLALALAETAVEESQADDLRTRVLLLRAKVALSSGQVKRAIDWLDQAEERAEANGESDLEAEVAAEKALAYAHRGTPDAERHHRLRALEIWERCAATLPVEFRAGFWAHPRRAKLQKHATSSDRTPSAVRTAPSAQDRVAGTERQAPEAKNQVGGTTDHARQAGNEGPGGNREQHLERLLAIYRRLSGSTHTREILDVAIDAAIELTGAERGFVILRKEEGAKDKLTLAVARNLDRERISHSAMKISRSIAEGVLRSGEPLLTAEARYDDRFSSNESVIALGLRSVICVPIPGPSGWMGALYLDNRFQRGRFGPTHLEIVLAFADQVGIVLNHARLRDELDARTKQLERERQRIAGLLEVRSREVERLNEQVRVAHLALDDANEKTGIVGTSSAIRTVLATVERVAGSTLTVLIQGESGTGKELVARAVHRLSSRREAPFVSVNCAALPETLLESELFGHVRGAFTGADRDRTGLMVHAKDGTIFLDEVGELPMSMQAKLLRALQEREIRPVGSTRSVEVAARVVGASNRNLREEVEAGRFREDLYYRLAVVQILVPPLRDRMEDCPLLVRHLLERLARRENLKARRISSEALRKLMAFEWPGNVRQLENVLSQALLFARDECITADDIILPASVPVAGSSADRAKGRSSYREMEAAEIMAALKASRWNASEVSRQLGIPRTSLYRKLKRYGLMRE